ncbi:MAG: NosD domain-containing protein, partial [Candidatus Thorarchaeota archaeon]
MPNQERGLFLIVLVGMLVSLGFFLGSPDAVSNIDSEMHPIETSGGFSPAADPVPHASIWIENNDDFITLGFTGTGEEGDPYIIENLIIDYDNQDLITIMNTDVHFVIRDCTLTRTRPSSIGINLRNVKNGNITNNVISNNGDGIRLFRCTNNEIKLNSFYLNDGLAIIQTESNSTLIHYNTVEDTNRDGFEIRRSHHCTIEHNIIRGGRLGIRMSESTQNKIRDNFVRDCTEYGFDVEQHSDSNIFEDNVVYSCEGGFRVRNCDNNRIFHNTFALNNEQGFDDNGGNYWYNDTTLRGNYWADYPGLDDGTDGRVAGDGIGDTNLPWPEEFMDYYPLIPDSDGDGLTDTQELFVYETLPHDPDCDDDLLWDGDEIAHGTEPWDVDTDKDGIEDGQEVHWYGTEPTIAQDFLIELGDPKMPVMIYGISMNFTGVTEIGVVTIKPAETSLSSPYGYALRSNYVDISISVAVFDSLSVGIEYDEVPVYYEESMHLGVWTGTWAITTTSVNTERNIVVGSVTCPSTIAAFEALPKHWTGAESSSWSNPNNWYPVGIPTSEDNVIIDSVLPYPHLDTTSFCNHIVVETGAKLYCESETLAVSGSWTINGEFWCGTGTVIFNGNTDILVGAEDFNNLIVDGASIFLTEYLVVYGDLTILSGAWTSDGSTVFVGGNWINYGTFNAAYVQVYGDWLNYGTFNAGTGTVFLYSNGDIVTGGVDLGAFYNLRIESETRILRDDISVEFNLFISDDATLLIETGDIEINTGTYVNIDGEFRLQITSASGDIIWNVASESNIDIDVDAYVYFSGFDLDNMVYIQSTDPLIKWNLIDNTISVFVPFVQLTSVSGSNAEAGLTIYADYRTNIDAGNNLNWIFGDTDGDGIPDSHEIAFYGTSPYKRDTDGDGYTDNVELFVIDSDPTAIGPIFVDANEDFWGMDIPGDGSKEFPFIIEGLTLAFSDLTIIHIQDTTVYFQIRLCAINGVDKTSTAIYLLNVINGEILDNTISDCYYGILIEDSSSITISRNEVSDCEKYGISLDHSTYNTIDWNVVSSNGAGFHASYSSFNSIENNIAEDDANGFVLENSWNLTLTENFASSIWNGYFIIASTNNTLIGNTAQSCNFGYWLVASSKNTIDSNIAISCTKGFHLWSNACENLLIRNTADGCVYGFHLNKTADNNQLILNTIKICDFGYYLSECGYNKLANNTVLPTTSFTSMSIGFHLYSSHHNEIVKNNFTYYTNSIIETWEITGFYFENSWSNKISENRVEVFNLKINPISGFSLVNCSSDVVSNNYIVIDSYGYSLGLGISHCENETLSGNQIYYCDILMTFRYTNHSTISDTTLSYELSIYRSDNNTIIDNTFFSLRLSDSHNNTISGNTISHGFTLFESAHNLIFHNDIMQAEDIDSEFGNYWYHPDLQEGNYWSDYLGLDDGSSGRVEGDGIGDTDIPWPDIGYDMFPLVEDSDEDGLTDIFELLVSFTDPSTNDTDSDSMLDGWEYKNGLDPNYWDDCLEDPDFDGLINLGEWYCKTDPTNPDSDFDTLPDGWEVDNGTNPLVYDLHEDPDADGLLNEDEFNLGTQADDSDSDDNGVLDGDEDFDRDGLPNALEIHGFGYDPEDTDSDDNGVLDGDEDFEGDGMPNWWEVEYDLEPLIDDSMVDQEPDGLTNLEEYSYGTNPRDEDTDEDKLLDYDEIFEYGTSPTMKDTDKDTIDDWEELIFYGTDPLCRCDYWVYSGLTVRIKDYNYGINLTFTGVIQRGVVTVRAIEPGATLPLGFYNITNYFNITTSYVEYSTFKVEMPFDNSEVLNGDNLRLLWLDNTWLMNNEIVIYKDPFYVDYNIIDSAVYALSELRWIYIDDDSDFEWFGFKGFGTEGKPYQIQDFTLSYPTDALIHIQDTTAYFEITICQLNGMDGTHDGIYLLNVNNGEILDNTIWDCYFGILVENSASITISLNDVTNCLKYGIALDYSTSCKVTWNDFYLNGAGFHSSFSSFSTVTDNTALDDSNGFVLEQSWNMTLSDNTANSIWNGYLLILSTNNTLTNNLAIDCNYGYWVLSSSNNTLEWNEAVGCNKGFNLWYLSFDNEILHNTALSCQIGYHLNNTCNDNTVTFNNASTAKIGFWLTTSDNNLLSDNIADVYEAGFYLQGSCSNILSRNSVNIESIFFNNFDILCYYLFESHNNMLSDNSANIVSNFNGYGNIDIYFFNLSGSHYNTFLGNSFILSADITWYGDFDVYGFYLDSCDNSIFDGNIIEVNIRAHGLTDGITTRNVYCHGFELSESNNNTLSGNHISIDILAHELLYHPDIIEGVSLFMSDNNTVSRNTIYICVQGTISNSLYGFSLNDSRENIFSENNLDISGSKSGNYGFHLLLSDNNSISKCNIIMSHYDQTIEPDFGFYLEEASHNLFFQNDVKLGMWFIADINSEYGNSWYHPGLLLGNYWPDYLGFDLNGDEVGDTDVPHPILGYMGGSFG